jgi:hypothetical protein
MIQWMLNAIYEWHLDRFLKREADEIIADEAMARINHFFRHELKRVRRQAYHDGFEDGRRGVRREHEPLV